MKKLFFLFLIVFCSLTFADDKLPKSAHQKLPLPANIEPEKLVLAKKLALASKVNKAIEDNFLAAQRYIERPAKTIAKNDVAATTDVKAKAKAEFINKKNTILQDSIDRVAIQLSKNFTAAELQYLMNLENYSLFIKYRKFLDSDPYRQAVDNPIKIAKDLLQQREFSKK